MPLESIPTTTAALGLTALPSTPLTSRRRQRYRVQKVINARSDQRSPLVQSSARAPIVTAYSAAPCIILLSTRISEITACFGTSSHHLHTVLTHAYTRTARKLFPNVYVSCSLRFTASRSHALALTLAYST